MKAGDQLGQRTLVKRLGAGGNGEVWKVSNDNGSTGALKVLKRQHFRAVRYQRFRDEVYLQTTLRGTPGILPVIDASIPDRPTAENPPWFVMPLAEALRHALGKAPAVGRVVEALAAIASTLAGLAEREISHRDIKPDNLFRLKGEYVVGDFGLVDYPGKKAVTAPGRHLGPLWFIAPEMLTSPESADGRPADVYSMAKTLWVLAADQLWPPQGEIRRDTPSMPLASWVVDPKAYQLDRLIEQATAHDPGDRPTMAEFARELRAWLTPTAEVARLPNLAELGARFAAATAPGQRRAEIITGWRQQAAETAERIEKDFHQLSDQVNNAGFANVVWSSGGSWRPPGFIPRATIGDPNNIWLSTSFLTISAPSTSGIDYLLDSVAAAELYDDGNLELFAVHYTLMRVGGRRDDRSVQIFWSDQRRAPVGSAQEEHALAELMGGLKSNLAAACERLIELASA